MFTATYLCVYMQYRANWSPYNFVMHMVQLAVVGGALAVAISRVTDNVRIYCLGVSLLLLLCALDDMAMFSLDTQTRCTSLKM